MSTKRADKHHERARALYRSVLINEAKRHGGVANLAAKINVPAEAIHKALDEKGGYKALRNMAHEVERKLANVAALAHVEQVANRADNPWRGIDADKYLDELRGTDREAVAIERLQADMARGMA